ncbi:MULTISPECIES: hypothetical protein [Pseudomonadaceae]|uniref:Uncharacterized protein n=1 Tax=Metapseudomonas otitidis TaxID=319939 RepID=A0A679GN50_9GAMM|nr:MULTISPECIES: hypothetical protein [Pseudomonas]BCA30915.1 hypothetical protein PtoMrB4_48920 [Pseudomonas otitidis]
MHAETRSEIPARKLCLSKRPFPCLRQQAAGNKAAYTRQVGFTPIQQEQMVLSYVQQHGQIKRAEVMELCRLSEDQAWQLLKRLMVGEKLVKHGERRWSFYTLPGAD